jgi:hypothetical protein
MNGLPKEGPWDSVEQGKKGPERMRVVVNRLQVRFSECSDFQQLWDCEQSHRFNNFY